MSELPHAIRFGPCPEELTEAVCQELADGCRRAIAALGGPGAWQVGMEPAGEGEWKVLLSLDGTPIPTPQLAAWAIDRKGAAGAIGDLIEAAVTAWKLH